MRPTPRGRLSAALDKALLHSPGPIDDLDDITRAAVASSPDIIDDEDLQLALTILYELHYRGVEGADPDWEWNADLLRARAILERALEEVVRTETAAVVAATLTKVPASGATAEAVAKALFDLVAADEGPSVSSYLQRHASLAQYREFLTHRSVYHLKEADPHTWAIPRLAGRAKAALVEVQSDEYGGGRPERMHSALFARAMRGVGLDDGYFAYIDLVPAATLATTNTISMFGLHRRLRGAVAGHLAALEMTSSIPNRRYGNGLRRLGFDAGTTLFFDEHVEADAVHEQIAGRDLAGGLVEEEPELLPDVLFGAATCLALDARAGRQMLAAWQEGLSSLRTSDVSERALVS